MTDWKDLEIKTLAQFNEWASDIEFTVIGATDVGRRSDVWARYAAQERAAKAGMAAIRQLMLDEARRQFPDATITELGDEIIVTLPGVIHGVKVDQILIDDPLADGLAPEPDAEAARLRSIMCPECHGKLDESGGCPDCGWARYRSGATRDSDPVG